jgi:nucleotide-binding universal stress UspA family protein
LFSLPEKTAAQTFEQEHPMIKITRILVAIDFSDVADAALEYGRTLAEHFHADLHLLHVAGDLLAANPALAYIPDLSGAQREAEQSARNQLFERAAAAKAVAAVHHRVVTSNTPAEAIVTYAQTAAIDLIVIGTHGRSGMSRLLMGSVAERVVRTAPCPVLTVHHPEHEFVLPEPSDAEARA